MNAAATFLSLALALTFAPQVLEGTGGVESLFTSVGKVGAPVTYGHLTFSLRMDDIVRKYAVRAKELFLHFCSVAVADNRTRCERSLEEDDWEHHLATLRDASGLDTSLDSRELRDLACAVFDTVDDISVLLFGKRTGKLGTRRRRQLETLFLGVATAVNFGMTIKNTHDIGVFREQLKSVEKRVDGLIHMEDELFNAQARDHAAIERLMKENLRMQKEWKQHHRVLVYLDFKVALERLLAEARETLGALGFLHQGLVATSLLNATRRDESYRQLGKMSAVAGLVLPLDRSDKLMSARAAYWTEGEDTIRFAMPVPLMPAGAKFLDAYRLEGEPATVPGPDGLQLVAQSKEQYVLVAPDRTHYYALTEKEWEACDRYGEYRFCLDARLRRDSFATTCIGALFVSAPERDRLCGTKVRRAPAFEATRVGNSLRVITNSTERVLWRLSCAGKPDNVTATTNGTYTIAVAEGCTLYGPELALLALPASLRTSAVLRLVVRDGGLPYCLKAFSNWTEVRTLLDQHDIDEYVEASVLTDMRAKRELSALREEQEEAARRMQEATPWLFIVISVGLALTAVAGAVVWCKLRGRQTRHKRRAGAAAMELADVHDTEFAKLRAELADATARLEAQVAAIAKRQEQASRKSAFAFAARPVRRDSQQSVAMTNAASEQQLLQLQLE